MMIKVIAPGSQDFGEKIAQEVKGSRSGLIENDLRDFIKRASPKFAGEFKRMEFAPGEVPIHLIAIGATEKYGCNRNGDSFREKACRDYHHTFVTKPVTKEGAYWYRSHLNKDPLKSYGIVKASHFNDAMKRIELIVALNGTKEAAERNHGLVAEDELQKLASDREISVSMACVLDPDAAVLTAEGYKRIEEIEVGDMVHTHLGRWKKVTQLNRRVYSGETVSVRMEGMPFRLELTADHPMYAKAISSYAHHNGEGKMRPIAAMAAEVESEESSFDWLAAGGGWIDIHISVM